MRRLFIAAIIAFGFASPALASHCPKSLTQNDLFVFKVLRAVLIEGADGR